MQSTRLASQKGIFYPDNCSKLSIYFEKFTEYIEDKRKLSNKTARAIIVPHAGYVYSGFSANMAYQYIKSSKTKRVIVIGPSHHHYFRGVSGSYYESYETPCGDLSIDTDYLISLSKSLPIGFEPKAHAKEHSTEVQMPFIKHYLPHTKVIELIYGDVSVSSLSLIIDTLLQDKNNTIIISTDLSHFYTKTKAKELDSICLEAIKKLDSSLLDRGCEACGLLGLKAMIISSKKANMHSHLIDYRTSADYSGDNSRVVGYGSAILVE